MTRREKTGFPPRQTALFRDRLLGWYRREKRDLPFRATRDPYKIWLSEIMLQQTTVATVLDYYRRFLERFPDPASVAAAAEKDVLTLWQGLGYYSRARHFKKACEKIVAEHGGRPPATFAELKELPGVGDYTAAAVASIAFGLPHAVVDGNVQRVFARLFAYAPPADTAAAKEFFATTAQALLDRDHPGDHNQAVMELGATVCRPKNPLCLACPVGDFCAARGDNAEKYPVKKKNRFVERTYHALLSGKGDSILLRPPARDSLIKGLWELPGLYESAADACAWLVRLAKKTGKNAPCEIGSVRHAITNKRITVRVYRGRAPGELTKGCRYVPRGELAGLPLNTIARKIIARFGG